MALLVTCKQGSPEWHAARAGIPTASRFSTARSWTDGLTAQQQKYVDALKAGRPAAAALSIAGYQKAPTAKGIELAMAGQVVGRPSDAAVAYARLLAAERISGQPLDDTFETYAIRRGQELEPVARELYIARTGNIVDEAGFLCTDDGLFGYSTDGTVYGEPGGIEIKCPNAADKVCGVWLDPAPVIAEYIDQVQGGMWLQGWKWIDLVVYTPWLESVGKELYVQRIHRDDDYIELLVADLLRFAAMTADIEAKLRGTEPVPLSETAPWFDSPQAPTPAPAPAPAALDLSPCF